jgi:DNA-binding CsgD family transcriptional regulator
MGGGPADRTPPDRRMTQLLFRAVPAPQTLPGWLPDAARRYVDHVGRGRSLRELARAEGVHPSTVLRQVRRTENRRDDPLIDEALAGLCAACAPLSAPEKETADMTVTANAGRLPDETVIEREARRILRRLSESGAFLAVAPEMEKAAVFRERPGARPARTAVVDRAVAHAFALKEWIACFRTGRLTAYEITGVGRAALKRLLAAEGEGRPAVPGGFAEASAPFADQHRDWDEREVSGAPGQPRERIRVTTSESPLAALARRREKDGKPFLSRAQVEAGERLREDFELAQMGVRVTQNWERFLVAGSQAGFRPDGGPQGRGAEAARDRLGDALSALGPGLGDIVLRVCCHLEGLETAEKRMGWSARSGKIVLRIALDRLRRHYEERHGRHGPLIG